MVRILNLPTHKISKIIVLHEYGAPEHYRALEHLTDANGATIEFREFRVVRKFLKGLVTQDFKLIIRSLRNSFWLLKATFGLVRSESILIGIAPFDWRILLLQPLIHNNTCSWHTSWPYWDGNKLPKPTHSKFVLKTWRRIVTSEFKMIYFATAYAQMDFLSNYKAETPTQVVYHSYNPQIYNLNQRVQGKGLTIGFVGRLEELKGIHLILELYKTHFKTPIRFILAGKGSLQNLLEKEAKDSGGQLDYRGFLSPIKLSKFYSEIDFLLLPSLRQPGWEELFGMVIIEAMACGAIPITTDHPGPKEILQGPLKTNIFSESDFVEGANAIFDKALKDPDFLARQRNEAINCAKEYCTNVISVRWRNILKL
jgi:glycosyltransferase involved in cell wall biosynthesis